MRRALATLSLTCLAVSAFAQSSQPPVSAMPKQPSFPNELTMQAAEALNKGREIAGDDLYPLFMQKCIRDQAYALLDDAAQTHMLINAQPAFDDLFFVGMNHESAWLVKTTAGYVLFDTLNNADQAENVIMAGIRKLGVNPADVKYVVITHEHGDHYGGARYLQDTYGIQAIASDAAWRNMDNGSANRPRRQITITADTPWTLGDKTFNFYLTPGHTNGTMSTIFSVRDGMTPHTVGFFGGLGIPASVAAKVSHINSLRRFETITEAAGVDVLIANHWIQDQNLERMELLRLRRPGDPHPLVLEKDIRGKVKPSKMTVYSRFLQVNEQCTRVNAARVGQVLPI